MILGPDKMTLLRIFRLSSYDQTSQKARQTSASQKYSHKHQLKSLPAISGRLDA